MTLTHPLVVLERRVGRETALLAWLAPAAVLWLLGVDGPLPAVVLLATLIGLAKRVTREPETEDLVDEAHAAYVEGDITEDELERRLTLLLDESATQTREAVEEVGGVGPVTSADIALSLHERGLSLDEVTEEELEDIHGVGPSTASAVVDYVQ